MKNFNRIKEWVTDGLYLMGIKKYTDWNNLNHKMILSETVREQIRKTVSTQRPQKIIHLLNEHANSEWSFLNVAREISDYVLKKDDWSLYHEVSRLLSIQPNDNKHIAFQPTEVKGAFPVYHRTGSGGLALQLLWSLACQDNMDKFQKGVETILAHNPALTLSHVFIALNEKSASLFEYHEWLLEKRANVNEKSVSGANALYYATLHEDNDRIEYFLAKGIAVKNPDSHSMNVLQLAYDQRNEKLFTTYLQRIQTYGVLVHEFNFGQDYAGVIRKIRDNEDIVYAKILMSHGLKKVLTEQFYFSFKSESFLDCAHWIKAGLSIEESCEIYSRKEYIEKIAIEKNLLPQLEKLQELAHERRKIELKDSLLMQLPEQVKKKKKSKI